nr:helix-turn-helix transcriptional regulator [Propionibacterium sp.]
MPTPNHRPDVDRVSELNPAHELTAARLSRGLSVRALARISGVAASTIVRIERGETDPTVGTFGRLLNACWRSLQVSEGAARASSTPFGLLPAAEAVARHAAEVAEIVEESGGRNIRLITADTPGWEDLDQEVVLLVERDEQYRSGEFYPLQTELRLLTGCYVTVVWDHGDQEPLVNARRCAAPLLPVTD